MIEGLASAELAGVLAGLAMLPEVEAAERVERIALLERIKHACAAAQARDTVALQRAVEAAAATVIERNQARRSVVSQVALARRESPHSTKTLVELATALTEVLPHTMKALTDGQISEHRASLVYRETACLASTDRMRVDAEIASRVAFLSNGQLVAAVRTAAYRLDPHTIVNRHNLAVTQRRVTCRPVADGMAAITALLPMVEGISVYATLRRDADAARTTGDPRGRGQIMADTLEERITGQTTATATPVEVQLVITDRALLAGANTPAHITGFGPVPASIARHLVANPDPKARRSLRRVYAKPGTGELVAVESKKRRFPKGLRTLIKLRDDTCRTPWCGAPIRHIDHVTPASRGGPTTAANGQGLCEHCNQTKESPGWHARLGPDRQVITTTPPGYEYDSSPPPLPHDPGTLQVDIWPTPPKVVFMNWEPTG